MPQNRWPNRIVAAVLLGTIALADTLPVWAQSVQLPMRRCQSYGGAASAGPTGFTSNEEAAAIVRQIAAHAGLAANFTVRPGETDGGAMAATCYDMAWRRIRRLIIYQPSFIAEIRLRSASYWALIGLLAHEIGHHANGHTLDRGFSHDKELEADRFAGFALGRMGASLEQAVSGIRAYGEATATATHPARDEREVAVVAGWRAAQRGPGGSATLQRARGNPRIIKAPAGISPLP